jgi:CRP/FNR family transcriptional regulator, cyclic AMP receptor protein
MYVIQEGEIVIRKKISSGEEIQLARFSRGDFVGEMALLESLPRFATAYAKGKTKVLVLRPGGFLLKIRRDPTFAFEMLQQLSRRIRITNERLVEVVNLGGSERALIEKILRTSELKYAEQNAQGEIDDFGDSKD